MSRLAEQVALELLREDGIEVVWELHVTASDAHRRGHHTAAKGLMEIADAAERICATGSIGPAIEAFRAEGNSSQGF